MGKLISGIVLLSLLALAVVGAVVQHDSDSGTAVLGGLLFLGLPGSLLTYFGRKDVATRKRVIETTLQVVREEGHADAGKIALGLGISEIVVRKILAKAQQTGIIPFKAEVA